MSDERDMLQEIERGEAWLRGAMPAVPPPTTVALKLRLRIAVHEAWLEDAAEIGGPLLKSSGTHPQPDLNAVKREVRAEIDGVRATRPLLKGSDMHRDTPRPRRHWAWSSGALAAAASIALVVTLSRDPGPAADDAVVADSAARLSDFAEVLNEAAPITDAAGSEWDDVEEVMLDSEDVFADASDSTWDDEFEDIGDELDSLLEEIGSDS